MNDRFDAPNGKPAYPLEKIQRNGTPDSDAEDGLPASVDFTDCAPGSDLYRLKLKLQAALVRLRAKDQETVRHIREIEDLRSRLQALQPDAPTSSGLTFITPAQLTADGVEETQYIVQNLLPEAALCLLTGVPKGGGKTTFVIHLAAALLEGVSFIGKTAQKTPVVYLSEQTPAGLHAEYLRPAGIAKSDDLHLLFRHNAAAARWPEVVRAAVARCLDVEARLMVVDTFAAFAGLRGDAENSAGDVMEKLEPLANAAAAHDLTIILVHHERKSGGSVVESARGSSALLGGVDLILNLARPQGNHPKNVRKLTTAGRFADVPDELVIALEDGRFIAKGESDAVASESARELALKVAPDNEADAERWKIMLDAAREHDPNVKKSTFHEAVKSLANTGRLRVLGKGVRGDPFRYYIPLEN